MICWRVSWPHEAATQHADFDTEAQAEAFAASKSRAVLAVVEVTA